MEYVRAPCLYNHESVNPLPPYLNCHFNPIDPLLIVFFGWICTNFHPFVPLVGKSEWQTVQLLPIAFIKVQSEFAPNDNSSFAFFSPKSSSGTDQNLQSWAPSGLMQMEIEMVIFNVILKSSSRSRSELANLSIHSFITCLLIKIVKQTLQIMQQDSISTPNWIGVKWNSEMRMRKRKYLVRNDYEKDKEVVFGWKW